MKATAAARRGDLRNLDEVQLPMEQAYDKYRGYLENLAPTSISDCCRLLFRIHGDKVLYIHLYFTKNGSIKEKKLN